MKPAIASRRAPLAILALLPLFSASTQRLGKALANDALPDDRGAAGLAQALRRLDTTLSVLHITAHPDDEDAALLTYLARGRGFRTMLLALTRGEGGANLISSHFFDALGVLRTLEMLEADRRYGVEQFFTRAIDYGYSKTIDEALKSWDGEDRILEDVVRVVRRERPDIIVARFRGDPRDGHGHHMFSGVMAQRVFEAAANPNRFRELQNEGLEPWQARKLYVPASPDADAAEVTIVDLGEYEPLLGRSFAQIAREAYGFHRSQGMSQGRSFGGSQKTRYRLAAHAGLDAAPERVERFESGLGGELTDLAPPTTDPGIWLGAVASALFEAENSFNPLRPTDCVRPLAAALGLTRKVASSIAGLKTRAGEAGGNDEAARCEHILFHLRRKESEIQKALVLALGIDVEAATDTGRRPPGAPEGAPVTEPFSDATPGQSFPVRVRAVNRGEIDVVATGVELRLPQDWKAVLEPVEERALGYNEVVARRFEVTVPADAEPTRPYWHRDSIDETMYWIDDVRYLTYPLPPPPARAVLHLKVLDEPFDVEVPVTNAVQDPVLGSRALPLLVAPPVSVQFTSEHGIVPVAAEASRAAEPPPRRSYTVAVTVRSSTTARTEGTLRVATPSDWTVSPLSAPFRLAREGEESRQEFSLSLPERMPEGTTLLEAVASVGGRELREGWTSISARDVSRFPLYRPARHRVRAVDVRVEPSLKLAYVMGSGDDVPACLTDLGSSPTLLSSAEVEAADLSPFDAVIVGVRAYAVRPELKTQHPRLMAYVENGGVLIVQYQTPEYDGDFGPFPYTMTRNPEEVSEEDSTVTILEPSHLLFASPNRITPADFAGWVEERGSKFWKTWDSRYTPLLECHDAGQEPQRGGMLFARYGKGAFVYTAYAWYRQLPHGVPGAYRIVANLISLRRTLAHPSG